MYKCEKITGKTVKIKEKKETGMAKMGWGELDQYLFLVRQRIMIFIRNWEHIR